MTNSATTFTTALALIAATCILTPDAVEAATIVYNFNDNNAVVDGNDFGAGVIASDVSTTTDTSGGGIFAGPAETRWQSSLRGGSFSTLSFVVTIPNGVTVDLTGLGFVDGFDSGAGTNQIFYGWDLSVSTGSVSASEADRASASTGSFVETNSNNITLSGLTGLTDTTVTFTLTAYNGTVYTAGTDSYSGGGSNARHSTIDDITITGTAAAVPEPSSTALLGLGGFALILRRRR